MNAMLNTLFFYKSNWLRYNVNTINTGGEIRYLKKLPKTCSDVILIVFSRLPETKLMRAWNIFGSVFILLQIFPCFSLIAFDRVLVTFFPKRSQ